MNCNCVRFSPNGQFLAIASDDYTVSVHRLERPADLSSMSAANLQSIAAAAESNPFASANLEDWSAYKMFRAHERDVYCVAWRSDSRLLASCSVDNKVMVYDVARKEILRTLRGHQNIVKGVAFDPIGKYLASQDDSCVKIWNLDTWICEKTITLNYNEPVSPMFIRLRFVWGVEYSVCGVCEICVEYVWSM